MFPSDKIVGKIKRSKKLFEGKEKSPWNKGTSKKKNIKKIFPPTKTRSFKQVQYWKVMV